MIKKIKDLLKWPTEAQALLWRIRSICTSHNDTMIDIGRSLKAIIEHHVDELYKENAAIIKRLSSLEMELILARKGCLDNNFEGKTDL